MDLSSLSEERLRKLRETGSPALQAAIDEELFSRNAGGGKSYARALGQAAFNLGDEFEAWARNGFSTKGDYELIKAQINSEIQRSYENNPGLYALEFGAGMAIPGAGLFKLGKGAQTIKGMVGRGAGVGFADGALGGYGASTQGNELGGTIAGAGIGTLFGGALAGAVPAVTRFFQGQTDPEAIIRDAAKRAGITPEAMIERMNQLGPEAVLADTFPELRGAAQGAATRSPFNESLQGLEERQREGRDRLVQEIQDVYPGEDATTAYRTQANLKAERQRIANQDYRPLDGASFALKDVSNLLNDPLVSREVNDAIKAYASENEIPIDTLKKLLFEGEPDRRVPARILQDARQMISDRIRTLAERGDTTLARKYGISLDRFDQRLDEVPGYTQANANYSAKSREIDAIQEGRDIGRSNRAVSTEEQILEETIDPVLRNYIGLGARSQIMNDIRLSGGIDGTGNTVSALGPLERRNLRTNAAQVPFLNNSLERESVFSETFNTVDPKRNSATAMRQAAVEEFDKANAVVGALADPVNGGLGSAMIAMWRKFVGEQLNIKSQDVADKVLDVLLKRGMTPEQIRELMNDPRGGTELVKFIRDSKLQAATAGTTAGALELGSYLYEQN